MERLNLQDSVMLGMESPACPFHIAGLMLFKLPDQADPEFLRELARKLERMPEAFPALGKKLGHSLVPGIQTWVEANDYDPAYHVHHYALPAPGHLSDLMALITRAHERPLNRELPLWEMHLIEGLADKQFALYCKFHHAIVDGMAARHMVESLLDSDPASRLQLGGSPSTHKNGHKDGLLGQFGKMGSSVVEQGRGIGQLYSLLNSMGRREWRERSAAPPLPYTATRSLFNQEITPQRGIYTVKLPLKKVKKIGATYDGTINDALIAICGGAIREYLLAQGKLPKKSLFAGIPVSVEPSGEHQGNQLSTIICPFATDLVDPVARMRRITHITAQAKADLHQLSSAASQDYMNLILVPGLLLSLSGASANHVPLPFNLIVSNVPGPDKLQYLDGAELESLYPLSLITDAQALNITATSYRDKLCLGIVACPQILPGIDSLPKRIKRSYKALLDSC